MNGTVQRAARVVVVALATVALLSGCRGSGADAPRASPSRASATPSPTSTATPSPTPSPTPSESPTTAAAPPAHRDAFVPSRRQGAAFVSPSGNIACEIEGVNDPPGSAQARCDIAQHSYGTPSRPKDCPLDYGDSFELDQRASLLCHGDTVAEEAAMPGSGPYDMTTWFDPQRDPRVLSTGGGPRLRLAGLRYGDSITFRDVTCTSRRTGVECRDHRTGHSFTVARASYRVD